MNWPLAREVLRELDREQFAAVMEVMAVACMGNPFDEICEPMDGGGLRFRFSERYLMVLDAIETLRQETGAKSVLDAGCWQGHLAMELAQRGFRVAGVDLADAGVIRARGRVGWLRPEHQANILGFWTGWIHEVLPTLGQFDIVVAQEVLEHVPDELVTPTCQALRDAAKVAIVVTVPAWDDGWPLHFQVFTPEALEGCLARPGWQTSVTPGRYLLAVGRRSEEISEGTLPPGGAG